MEESIQRVDTAEAEIGADLTGMVAFRRAAWGLADQGVYSITNVAVAVFVARSVGSAEFGAFAALYVAYVLSIGLCEALTAEVFTVVHTTSSSREARTGLRAAAGCAVVLGFFVGFIALAVSLVTDGPVAELLPAFAVIIPGLFLQDFWRYALFAFGRPVAAFTNDLTWAAVQIAAFLAILHGGHPTVSAFLLAWGAGGLAGAMLGLLQVGVVPHPQLAWRWLRRQRAFTARFAVEWMTLYAAAQLVFVLVGVSAGLASLGQLRAAQVLFGPMQALLNGARLSLTSLAVRVQARTPRQLRRFCVWISCGLAVIALFWTAVALALPEKLGEDLLGDSWRGARRLLLPIGANGVAVALSFGALAALRATRAVRRSLRVRTTYAFITVLLGGGGAAVGGAEGAALGLAAASTVALVMLWWQAVVVTREVQIRRGSPNE